MVTAVWFVMMVVSMSDYQTVDFNSSDQLRLQAELFGAYLVAGKLSDVIRDRYGSFIATQTAPGQQADYRLLGFALAHPKTIGLLDAYCAFRNPQNELRRRLYYMFAILESTPEYSDSFLSKHHSLLYVPILAAICTRSVFRLLAGVALVTVKGLVR